MASRKLSTIGGFVHDIDHVDSLAIDQYNLRLLSDRSLYLLQNLSGDDLTFLSRYGTILTDGFYSPVQSGTSDAELVEESVNVIRSDLNSMAIEDTLECICTQMTSVASTLRDMLGQDCGCNVGQGEDNEDGERGGDVPGDVGTIVYEEPSAAQDRRCKAANSVYDALYNIFAELEAHNVDDMGVLGLALVIGIVSGIVASAVVTPVGGLVVAVAGAMAVFTARLIGVTVDLADIVSAMEDRGQDLVCALNDSVSASEAKADYLEVLDGWGVSDAGVDLVGLLMTNTVLNILFFDTAESVDFWSGYTGSYDCDDCETASGQWEFTEHNGTPAGTGSLAMDGQERVLTAVETTANVWRLWIQIPEAFDPTPVQINRVVEYVSESGFVEVPTAINYGICINSVDGYPYVYNHTPTGAEPPSGEMTGCNFNMTSNASFTATWILTGGNPEGPC